MMQMIKQLRNLMLILAGLLPVLLVASSGIAEAHVLKQDNGITVVLHIPPEDNPVAGKQQQLAFAYGDQKEAFGLPDCNCRATLVGNGRTIDSQVPQPIITGATLDGQVFMTFPTIGIYHLIVEGTPKHNTFHSFKIDFLVRVSSDDRTAAASNGGPEVLIASTGSLIVLGMVGYTAMGRGGRYVTQPAPKLSQKSTKPQKKSTPKKQ